MFQIKGIFLFLQDRQACNKKHISVGQLLNQKLMPSKGKKIVFDDAL